MIHQILRRCIDEPEYLFKNIIPFLAGCFYIIFYRLSHLNVKIKFPFRTNAKVKIKGPGSVSIGENCTAVYNSFKGLTIITLSADARVNIGNRCSLGGLTIRCRNEVVIDDKTMTANSLVQDCLIVEQDKLASGIDNKRHLKARPIFIGKNVWLGTQTCILGGSVIGNDSVISAGSVCYSDKIDPYCIAVGNPIRKSLSIDHILKLKR